MYSFVGPYIDPAKKIPLFLLQRLISICVSFDVDICSFFLLSMYKQNVIVWRLTWCKMLIIITFFNWWVL